MTRVVTEEHLEKTYSVGDYFYNTINRQLYVLSIISPGKVNLISLTDYSMFYTSEPVGVYDPSSISEEEFVRLVKNKDEFVEVKKVEIKFSL